MKQIPICSSSLEAKPGMASEGTQRDYKRLAVPSNTALWEDFNRKQLKKKLKQQKPKITKAIQ